MFPCELIVACSSFICCANKHFENAGKCICIPFIRVKNAFPVFNNILTNQWILSHGLKKIEHGLILSLICSGRENTVLNDSVCSFYYSDQ